MSCLECNSSLCSMSQCSACERPSCNAMFICCEDCKSIECMECIEECEVCEALLCTKCKVQDVVACKCCKKEMNGISQPTLCVLCVITHWFSTYKGYICDVCLDHCSQNQNGCTVSNILDQQTECPICLEPFESDYSLQHCDLHKVCISCNYEKNRGCPICRVGKV